MSTRQIVVAVLLIIALFLIVCTLLAGGLILLNARSLLSVPRAVITPRAQQISPGLQSQPVTRVPSQRVPSQPVPTSTPQPRALASATAQAPMLPTEQAVTEAPAEATPTVERPSVWSTPFLPVAPITLTAEDAALSQLYEKVNPSVVYVDVQEQVDMGNGQPLEVSGNGSGFIIDKAGYIVTNYHVVQNARTIEVVLYDDTRGAARVLGVDPDSDIAVIKVDMPADRLVPIELGDSDQVKVGERAIAIGNPFGFQGTMTLGIISAIGRTIQSGTSQFSIPLVIQTDAPINPGNSGGPLLDPAGRVIGVNAQIRSEARANSGVGFAIPINVVKKILPDLITKGSYTWPWLGVLGTTLDPDQIKANNLSVDRGAYISGVVEGGPAAKAGIHGERDRTMVNGRRVSVGGDVVVAVDGNRVTKFDDLLLYVTRNGTVGQAVTLSVLRDGKQQDIQVTLEARPRSVEP